MFVKINNNEKEKETRIIYEYEKTIFCRKKFVGRVRVHAMTVISEGLLLNSKYIKMGREEEGFQAFLTQPPIVLFAMRFDGYPFTALRP